MGGLGLGDGRTWVDDDDIVAASRPDERHDDRHRDQQHHE